MPVLSFYYVRNFLVPLIHIDKRNEKKRMKERIQNTDKTISFCQHNIIVKLFSLSFVNIAPFLFCFSYPVYFINFKFLEKQVKVLLQNHPCDIFLTPQLKDNIN